MIWELSRWLRDKESACNTGAAGDANSIPGWGRSLEEGMATPSSILVQKLLIRSHLFIFAFISNILGGGHRGSCCDLCRIYLFLAALGFCCCTQIFPSCGEQGLLFTVVHRLLIAVASLVVEHRLSICVTGV